MMLKKIKNYLFQFISLIFVLYGFYLFYLFLLDTTLRTLPKIANFLSILITFTLLSLTLIYWIKKKRLPL
ncbi:MAG: hypothetical protein ACK4VK_07010 [Aquificaceae bacterium]